MKNNGKVSEVRKTLSPDEDYFEYDGYLVSKAKLPWIGTYIYTPTGEWNKLDISNGDTALFPMEDAKALDILNNGYPVLAK